MCFWASANRWGEGVPSTLTSLQFAELTTKPKKKKQAQKQLCWLFLSFAFIITTVLGLVSQWLYR